MAVNSKREMHLACTRNGFYMPSLSSSITTMHYMAMVRCGQYWTPRYVHIKMRPCPHPPSKELLLIEVQNYAQHSGLKTGIVNQSQVNIEWLLLALSTLYPDHPFFHKSYEPERLIKKEQLIDNSDGFFSNLPQSRTTKKRLNKNTLKKYDIGFIATKFSKMKMEDFDEFKNEDYDQDDDKENEKPVIKLVSRNGKKIHVEVLKDISADISTNIQERDMKMNTQD